MTAVEKAIDSYGSGRANAGVPPLRAARSGRDDGGGGGSKAHLKAMWGTWQLHSLYLLGQPLFWNDGAVSGVGES